MCELHVHLPSSESSISAMTRVETPLSVATVYRLNSSRALDERKISFASRPPRLYKVDDLTAMPWKYRVTCKSEELLSFELTRPSYEGGEKTRIEWWQDDDDLDERAGMFIANT